MVRIKFNFVDISVVITLLLISFSGCGKQENKLETDILAQVGEHTINVTEFLLNYEFGFANLKKNPDRKLSYLDFMINEKLLSLEGYRLGLDKTEHLQILEKRLLQELLVEEIFKNEVDEKIKISPEEIKEAISKSTVGWKLRYWVRPTLEASEYLFRAMQERGNTKMAQENLETDYLTWMDFPPELLESIKNLEIGELSEPVEYNRAYYLFQVTDILREGISDYDYQYTYKRYEQILYYRKLNLETTKFVSNFMTPKNVVTKGKTFQIFADALAEWRKQGKNAYSFSESLEKAGNTEPAMQHLNDNLEKTFIIFDGGQWSLKVFITHFNPASVKIDPSKAEHFRRELKHQIALSIRDYFLAKEAAEQGLDKSPDVREQLQMWRDKWVYEETRRFFTKNVEIDETTALNYFNSHKSRFKTVNGNEPTFREFENLTKRYAYIEKSQALLEEKIRSLKKEFTVHINQAMLDKVSVIDFEKSRWAHLLLFKRGSGRLALPSVDPTWGFEANYN